jgi:hypothetical protein
MGLLAYVLWALFGLGLGAVLRSQVVAAVAAIAVYAGGAVAVELITHLLYGAFHASWLLSLTVLAPAQASNVMITAGTAFQDARPGGPAGWCWPGTARRSPPSGQRRSAARTWRDQAWPRITRVAWHSRQPGSLLC